MKRKAVGPSKPSMTDFIRHGTCCTKVRYASSNSTQKALFRLQNKGMDIDGLNPYYCIFCNDFHLGRKLKPSTLKLLGNLEFLLQYDFRSDCPVCIGNHCVDRKNLKPRKFSAIKTVRDVPRAASPPFSPEELAGLSDALLDSVARAHNAAFMEELTAEAPPTEDAWTDLLLEQESGQ